MSEAVGVLTTTEAASAYGVREATLRQWVRRGRLTPLRRGARPLRFRERDLADAVRSAMPAPRRSALDEAATRWRAAVVATDGDRVSR